MPDDNPGRPCPVEAVRAIIQKSVDGLFIKDVDDNYRYVWTNETLRDRAGLDPVGHTDFDLFGPLAETIRRQDEAAASAGGEVVVSEITQHFRGSPCNLRLRKCLHRGVDGHRYLLCSEVDITETAQAYTKMHSAFSFLNSLLDKLPVGVVVKDADHDYRFLRANAAFARAVERTVPEILGHTDAELKFKSFNAAVCGAQDRAVMRTNVPVDVIERSPRADGEHRSFAVTKFPLHLPDGRNVLVGTFADVTRIHDLAEGERIVNAVMKQLLTGQTLQEKFDVLARELHAFFCCDGLALLRQIGEVGGFQTAAQYFVNGIQQLGDAPDGILQQILADNWPRFLKGEQPVIQSAEGAGYHGARTIILTPVFVGKEFWGVLAQGFHSCRRLVSDTDLRLLMLLADVVSLYVSHVRQERALHESQRLEAIAMIASSVAHDFNNILQAILGFSELALMDLPADSPARQSLEAIRKAGLEGCGITGQMLVFARSQVAARPLREDLNAAVRDLMPILRRLAGKTVAVSFVPAPEPCPVWVESAQVSQLLTNLVVNARDAIVAVGRPGHVRITLACGIGRTGGSVVRLSVADDGIGMDEATQQKIFRPFFTTKPVGKGTGLGLATVHTIMARCHGEVELVSVPGRGTTFTLVFPLREAANPPPEAQ